MKRFTLLLVFYVSVIFLITSIDAIAHQPDEIWLSEASRYFENAEKACRTAARNLSELDNVQRIAKSDWDDNNEDMRDQSISSLGSAGDLSITSLFSDAAILGLDLYESMSLSEILSAAISATQSKKQELQGLINKRDTEKGCYDYFIDSHNSRHDTPTNNYGYDDKENFDDDLHISTWTFNCAGGCSMSMDSPISSHRDWCGGCGKKYHTCAEDEEVWHRARPCTRKIKVSKEVIDPQYGSTYFIKEEIDCTVTHRWCTDDKGPHKITIKLNGSKVFGTYTIHRPIPQAPLPPEQFL